MRHRPRRLSRSSLLAFAVATLWFGGCQKDSQCVQQADCPTTDQCIPDSSGVGHCISNSDIFGVTDAGQPDAG